MNTLKTEHPNTKKLLEMLSIFDSDIEFLEHLKKRLAENKSFLSLGFLNQYGFNLIFERKDVLSNFAALDFMLRDGAGISFALKHHKMQNGANLNGTDLIPKIIEVFNSLDSVDYYVFGTQSPWLEQGSNRLIINQSVKVLHGFHDYAYYIEYLKNNISPLKRNVIVLAMGMPKQELLAEKIKNELEGEGIIICGGAIIDFYAERYDRAPLWLQKLSLEWLYRFLQEPKRLFRRYAIGIPVFLYRVLETQSLFKMLK